MRTLRFAPLLFVLLAAAPLAAQEPEARIYSTHVQRARLGVSVDLTADEELDAVGARIRGVLPDSPAEKAGLKPGDIITKVDGQSLADARSDEQGESGPGRRLVELARKFEPGDTVKLEYRRNGRARSATVVVKEMGFGPLAQLPQLPRMRQLLEETREFPGARAFRFSMDPPGLHLAEMNPGLGEYFGTDEGLLVLESPADSALPLRAGDVIRSIDGRKPQSAEHASRILRSYAKGEQVKLEITRQRRQSTVTWTVPEREPMGYHGAEPSRMRAPMPTRAPRAPRVERS